jgi:hypothetical protein
MPFFLVADDAFALRTWLMKPFSKRGLDHDERVFNYRLSRARRVVENAFGILAHRFRCLLGFLELTPATVEKVVNTCICLHILRIRYSCQQNHILDAEDPAHNLVPGAWREGAQMDDCQRVQVGNRDTKEANKSTANGTKYARQN